MVGIRIRGLVVKAGVKFARIARDQVPLTGNGAIIRGVHKSYLILGELFSKPFALASDWLNTFENDKNVLRSDILSC